MMLIHLCWGYVSKGQGIEMCRWEGNDDDADIRNCVTKNQSGQSQEPGRNHHTIQIDAC